MGDRYLVGRGRKKGKVLEVPAHVLFLCFTAGTYPCRVQTQASLSKFRLLMITDVLLDFYLCLCHLRYMWVCVCVPLTPSHHVVVIIHVVRSECYVHSVTEVARGKAPHLRMVLIGHARLHRELRTPER